MMNSCFMNACFACLNACFIKFAVLLVLVSQFQTISSHCFANINADFILPSHFYDRLHCPSASTEFVLKHATETNRDQQRY